VLFKLALLIRLMLLWAPWIGLRTAFACWFARCCCGHRGSVCGQGAA